MKKVKQSVHRNKVIIGSILALSCLTAIGVGFSSWIIATQTVEDKSNITIKAADVVDQRFTMTVTMTDGNVTFGPLSNATGLIVSDGKDEEDLTYAFKLTFTPYEGQSTFSYLTSTFNISFSFTNTLDLNSSEKNYVSFPEDDTVIGTLSSSGLQSSLDNVTITNDAVSGYTLIYTSSLSWGSAFGNKNPCSTVTENNLQAYITALNDIKSIVGDSKQLEITVKASTSN